MAYKMSDKEYEAYIEWILYPKPFGNPEQFYGGRRDRFPFGFPYYAPSE